MSHNLLFTAYIGCYLYITIVHCLSCIYYSLIDSISLPVRCDIAIFLCENAIKRQPVEHTCQSNHDLHRVALIASAALKFFWTCAALKLVDDDDDDDEVTDINYLWHLLSTDFCMVIRLYYP